MKILIATWHQQVIAGTEAYVREIIPELRARGHEVALVVESLADDPSRSVDPSGTVPTWCLTDEDPARVWVELCHWGPDRCFLQGFADPSHERELLKRFLTVRFIHSYVGTCISGAKRFKRPDERPCDRSFGPACLALYLPRGCGGLNPLTMIRDYRTQRTRQDLFPRYTAVVVASRHMRDELIRNGMPDSRVSVNPLFPSGAAPDPEPPAPRPRTGKVAFVGRLHTTKGGAHAILALHHLKQRFGMSLRLTVVGDGPERGDLESLAARLEVEVDFLGWRSGTERDAVLRDSDALLVPSLWPEPFGLVGVEAGRLGVPAVGYAVGGITDWLIPGQTGELADGKVPNPTHLAVAIRRLFATDEHWQATRVHAWRFAQQLTVANHVDRLEGVLSDRPLRPDVSNHDARLDFHPPTVKSHPCPT